MILDALGNDLSDVDMGCPINPDSPFAENLVAGWFVTPQIEGGRFFYELAKYRYHPTNESAARWSQTDFGPALNCGANAAFTQRIESLFRSGDQRGCISALYQGVGWVFSTTTSTSVQHYIGCGVSASLTIFMSCDSGGGYNNATNTSVAVNDGKPHFTSWYSNSGAGGWAAYHDGIARALTATSGSNTGDWFADVANRDRMTIGGFQKFDLTSRFNGWIHSVWVHSREPAGGVLSDFAREALAGYPTFIRRHPTFVSFAGSSSPTLNPSLYGKFRRKKRYLTV